MTDWIDRPSTLQAGDDDFLWTRRPDRLIAPDERGPLDPLVHVRPPDFQSSGIDGKNLLSPELGGVSGFAIVDFPIVAVAPRRINIARAWPLVAWFGDLFANIPGFRVGALRPEGCTLSQRISVQNGSHRLETDRVSVVIFQQRETRPCRGKSVVHHLIRMTAGFLKRHGSGGFSLWNPHVQADELARPANVDLVFRGGRGPVGSVSVQFVRPAHIFQTARHPIHFGVLGIVRLADGEQSAELSRGLLGVLVKKLRFRAAHPQPSCDDGRHGPRGGNKRRELEAQISLGGRTIRDEI